MFDLPTFTLIHVVISVLGIISGLVVVGGLMSGARLDGWTHFFLATTIVTSVTGYGFPFTKCCRRTSWARSRSSCWPSAWWRCTGSNWPVRGARPM